MKRLQLDIFGTETYEQGDQAYPPIDLLETPEELIIETDLPGINSGDVSLKYLDGSVIIEGRKRQGHAGAKRQYLCMERIFERFRRSVKIPVPVNAGSAVARLANGVLTITFKKVNEKRGRPISIKIVTDED